MVVAVEVSNSSANSYNCTLRSASSGLGRAAVDRLLRQMVRQPPTDADTIC